MSRVNRVTIKFAVKSYRAPNPTSRTYIQYFNRPCAGPFAPAF